MTPPAVYGADISDAARMAYGRWISALCDRTAHQMACPFGCGQGVEMCGEGRTYAALEQTHWRAWRALLEGASHLMLEVRDA